MVIRRFGEAIESIFEPFVISKSPHKIPSEICGLMPIFLSKRQSGENIFSEVKTSATMKKMTKYPPTIKTEFIEEKTMSDMLVCAFF